MKTNDFINQAIGHAVYVTGSRDLAFNGGLRRIIFNKTPLKLLKMTRGGLAYVHDELTDEYFSIPPSNIREYSELKPESDV